MSEKNEIIDIINNIDSIDGNQEEEIVLFDDANVQPVFETPFGQENKKDNKPVYQNTNVKDSNTTIIGATTNITGNLVADGSFDIKGKIKGDVTASNNIEIKGGEIEGNISCENIKTEPGMASKITGDIVAKNDAYLNSASVVKGNITAKNVALGGIIEGDVDCGNSLIISKTAVINGNITAASFQVESGAQVNGQVSIKH